MLRGMQIFQRAGAAHCPREFVCAVPVQSAIIIEWTQIMPLTIEVEQEDDGRWLAEVLELPGVLTYGQTRQEAIQGAQALSLRVLADRLEHGESVPQMGAVFAVRLD
jgi:predicted RNase H-like HicB family nuclease